MKQAEGEASSSWAGTTSSDMGSNGMTTAMEALSTDPPPISMEVIKIQHLIALRVR